jgi:hypothetical protein
MQTQNTGGLLPAFQTIIHNLDGHKTERTRTRSGIFTGKEPVALKMLDDGKRL